MMKRVAIVIVSVVALATFGGLCFRWGTQAATENFWLPQHLREKAYEVWLIAKAKSAIRKGSLDDLEWLDRERRDAESVLFREEHSELVKEDQTIQRLLNRVSEIDREQ